MHYLKLVPDCYLFFWQTHSFYCCPQQKKTKLNFDFFFQLCRKCSDCGSRTPGSGQSSRWHANYTGKTRKYKNFCEIARNFSQNAKFSCDFTRKKENNICINKYIYVIMISCLLTFFKCWCLHFIFSLWFLLSTTKQRFSLSYLWSSL